MVNTAVTCTTAAATTFKRSGSRTNLAGSGGNCHSILEADGGAAVGSRFNNLDAGFFGRAEIHSAAAGGGGSDSMVMQDTGAARSNLDAGFFSKDAACTCDSILQDIATGSASSRSNMDGAFYGNGFGSSDDIIMQDTGAGRSNLDAGFFGKDAASACTCDSILQDTATGSASSRSNLDGAFYGNGFGSGFEIMQDEAVAALPAASLMHKSFVNSDVFEEVDEPGASAPQYALSSPLCSKRYNNASGCESPADAALAGLVRSPSGGRWLTAAGAPAPASCR
jgi:hypothetical protein